MTDTPHIMIVEARFYPDISDELATGAIAVLQDARATYEIFQVPGAFEIPAAIRMAVRAKELEVGRRRFMRGERARQRPQPPGDAVCHFRP